eukprot:m.74396 g.74396  ORF g.74396 m.74396 type:complete len:534 (+) comp12457_c0_seq1:114-1715(+)
MPEGQNSKRANFDKRLAEFAKQRIYEFSGFPTEASENDLRDQINSSIQPSRLEHIKYFDDGKTARGVTCGNLKDLESRDVTVLNTKVLVKAAPRDGLLFIGNINGLTQEDIKALCEVYGTVVAILMVNCPETGFTAGYGIVEFLSRQEAEKAESGLHLRDVSGRVIRVNLMDPKESLTANSVLSKTLVIHSIPSDFIKASALMRRCAAFGEVEFCRIIKSDDVDESKQHALVDFRTPERMLQACRTLGGKTETLEEVKLTFSVHAGTPHKTGREICGVPMPAQTKHKPKPRPSRPPIQARGHRGPPQNGIRPLQGNGRRAIPGFNGGWQGNRGPYNAPLRPFNEGQPPQLEKHNFREFHPHWPMSGPHQQVQLQHQHSHNIQSQHDVPNNQPYSNQQSHRYQGQSAPHNPHGYYNQQTWPAQQPQQQSQLQQQYQQQMEQAYGSDWAAQYYKGQREAQELQQQASRDINVQTRNHMEGRKQQTREQENPSRYPYVRRNSTKRTSSQMRAPYVGQHMQGIDGLLDVARKKMRHT